ncbi:protein RD3-like [Denticeps clupeoides]|uniref:Protein RD3-like n=1 Tax=Denticeps clupeoides TaxID=299321 RepID=A0AAY4AX93_9TELE|nr:protein RD3-like [Denticeps clupeoides]
MDPQRRGQQTCRNQSPQVPLSSWMKWPRAEGGHVAGSCPAPGIPNRVLLRELLWQLEQREYLAREEELKFHLSCGTVGYRQQGHPGLRPLMPSSERRQLERLCARVPPSHTDAVLYRFREILACNNFLPWELVCVFKQVLRDFVTRQEEQMYCRSPQPAAIESRTSSHQAGEPSTSPADREERRREEIPTISSYVDRHLSAICPYTVHRDWSLPFCHTFPYDCPEAYSTTL